MPAGRRNICEACYWSGLYLKRVKIDLAALGSPQWVASFTAFSAWLQQHAGSQRAAMYINRYIPFFMEMERRWDGVPIYSQLVEHFGAEGLRRVRLLMQWLVETRQLIIDPYVKAADSESRRIRELISLLPPDSPCGRMLRAYHDQLWEKMLGGRSKLCSVRLALTPAAHWLLNADSLGMTQPNQRSLNGYLKKSPGQRAAISGFVHFLNSHHGLNLSCIEDKRKSAGRRRRRLEALLLELARHWSDSDEFRLKWVRLGLVYFHYLPMRSVRCLSVGVIKIERSGFMVNIDSQEYWVPSWITDR